MFLFNFSCCRFMRSSHCTIEKKKTGASGAEAEIYYCK